MLLPEFPSVVFHMSQLIWLGLIVVPCLSICFLNPCGFLGLYFSISELSSVCTAMFVLFYMKNMLVLSSVKKEMATSWTASHIWESNINMWRTKYSESFGTQYFEEAERSQVKCSVLSHYRLLWRAQEFLNVGYCIAALFLWNSSLKLVEHLLTSINTSKLKQIKMRQINYAPNGVNVFLDWGIIELYLDLLSLSIAFAFW